MEDSELAFSGFIEINMNGEITNLENKIDDVVRVENFGILMKDYCVIYFDKCIRFLEGMSVE